MRANEFIQETPLPPDWDAEQVQVGKGTTFKSRINYAKSQADRLGTGSSRVAFVIPFEGRDTVLKVAKNRKGLAQNNEEVSILKDGYLGRLDIVIPLGDFDGESGPDVSWLQTEKAEPISEIDLEDYFGTHLSHLIAYSAATIGHWTRSRYRSLEEQKAVILKQVLPRKQDIFIENADMMADLISNTSLDPTDFGWYKNWGWYRNRPVIIDLGFAGSVIPMYRMR